jgi:hypothetical protein
MAISALCHDSLLRHFFTTLAGYPRDEDTITSNRVYAEIHVCRKAIALSLILVGIILSRWASC